MVMMKNNIVHQVGTRERPDTGADTGVDWNMYDKYLLNGLYEWYLELQQN